MEVSIDTNLASSFLTQSNSSSQAQSFSQPQPQPHLPYTTPSSPGSKKRTSEDVIDDNTVRDKITTTPAPTTTSTTISNFSDNKENHGRNMEKDQTKGQSYEAMDVDSSLAKPTELHSTTSIDKHNGSGTVANINGDINTVPNVGAPLNLVPNFSTGPQTQTQPQTPLGQPQSGDAMQPAQKKRKLSPASRQAKQQEKEAKERQRVEEKAKKEEEKKAKEEEKRKREAEREEEKKKKEAEREEERKRREEKKKAKEDDKAAKEEEKRKKEQDKQKKERTQTRLNAFFTKPKPTAEARTATPESSPKKPLREAASVDCSPNTKTVISDYNRMFPDFFLQSHTSVAPPHRFQRDSEALAHTQSKVDSYLKAGRAGSCQPLAFRPADLFRMIPYKRRRGNIPSSVKDILLHSQTVADDPEYSGATQKLRDSLKGIQMKSIKFGEDVRPPYQGTYTKRLPEANVSRLMRNPFRRELPDTNYDYDSEAEWEEPEDGEDLDSEEEDDASEEGEDDMDGFLDDEEDQLADGKRRLLVGDLEPVCTGIRWQEQSVDPELQIYKIETIMPTVTFPIDPFSISYWRKPVVADPAPPARSTLHTFMGNSGPRQPSENLPMQEGSALATGKPKRAFPVEQLGEFKQAVEGSDLTKTGLIEVLKKRFPKVSKDVLKDTLNSVATRVGQKEADKKWLCK